jgi:hypothetical protein
MTVVHAAGHATDRAAFAHCIATLEDHDHLLARCLQVSLQLQQLDLIRVDIQPVAA